MSTSIEIPAGDVYLAADLTVPQNARGIVIFVHGSGSSRFSSRNRRVASALNESGLATLLADLLTPQEEELDRRTAALRFDIALLAERTENLIDWARVDENVRHFPIGLFGASTGAAAAIIAGTNRSKHVRAIVSRGGRVDLAGPAIDRLRTPLLMIVGGLDFAVLDLHEKVLPRFKCPHDYRIIAGASHLFEEPGALDRVARLAIDWFEECEIVRSD